VLADIPVGAKFGIAANGSPSLAHEVMRLKRDDWKTPPAKAMKLRTQSLSSHITECGIFFFFVISCRALSVEWIGKDLEGICRGLLEAYYPDIFLEVLMRHTNHVRIAGVPVEIRTENLSNRSLYGYRYSHLLDVIQALCLSNTE
jgi:hypothetical protein